ncbi:MAG: ABC transporter substrate-binding protein, partial [Rubrivivax sp.]
MSSPSKSSSRRHFLQAGAASVVVGAGLLPAHTAQAAGEKILIGYWPIASGLPLYTALERGFFKEAGLNVEGVKFASAQQVAEAMIAGRTHGSANGTASAALGLAEIVSPGLYKIICSNPSNHKLVLDQFV